MSIVDDVLQQPAESQFSYAMSLLRQLTADDAAIIAHYRDQFGVTPLVGRFVHYLASNAGWVRSSEQIMTAIYDSETDVDESIIKTLVHFARKADIEIELVYGTGYRISKEIAARVLPKFEDLRLLPLPLDLSRGRKKPVITGRRWDADSDAMLSTMVERGDEVWTIADTLQRTERSIRERLKNRFGTSCPIKARDILSRPQRPPQGGDHEPRLD